LNKYCNDKNVSYIAGGVDEEEEEKKKQG